MTDEYKQNFLKNQEVIYAGYQMIEPGVKVCRTCDCEGYHECLICGDELDEEGCTRRDGLCWECHDQKEAIQ